VCAIIGQALWLSWKTSVCSSARPLLDMPMEMCTGFRDQLLGFPSPTHIVFDLAYKKCKGQL